MNLNKSLKNLRKGETQKETAKKIGIPYANYNKYETTNTLPDLETLIKIADYYQITTDSLLEHEVPYLLDKSAYTPEQQELIKQIKLLSKVNCQRVSDYIMGIMVAEEEKQKIIEYFNKENKE